MKVKTIDEKLKELDFEKMSGLIPTAIMDVQGNLLVLAYSSKESLANTLETGVTYYHSRTEGKTLQKTGQRVVEIKYNCSRDALQFTVEQTGVACHTGNYSCFHKSLYR